MQNEKCHIPCKNPISEPNAQQYQDTGDTSFYFNPIIPGFYPDPSVCRVDDTYYMVNSSFEFFPGVPIHSSKDLVNWKQIGHVLERPSQLAMMPGMKGSCGIWAPTIRFHDGLFYMITTAQNAGGNFYVTAKNPEGPWSDPVWLHDAPGIDPSLFWDDDGTCWYSGAGWIEGGKRWPNENRIYIQELDLAAGKLIGKKIHISSGYGSNAEYAEGPHIYKRNGTYILLIAEGGTGNNHAVTIHHAEKITGPYIPDLKNPVLTHRHLGDTVPITTIGHADIVETQNGEWWAVMLGVRPVDGLNIRGRETFLTPLSWSGKTPVFNPGIGRVLESDKRPNLPWTPVQLVSARDDFTSPKLDYQWNFLRTPFETWWNLETRPSFLTIKLRPETLRELVNPSVVLRRIQHAHYKVKTAISFIASKPEEVGGLIAMQNDKWHFRLVLGRDTDGECIKLFRVEDGIETLVAHKTWLGGFAILAMEGSGTTCSFFAGKDESSLVPIGSSQDTSILSTNKALGFIGPYVGMYASSNGAISENIAEFDWFEYKGQFPI